MLFDRASDTFSCNHCLSIIGVQKKSGEFFTSESSRDITGPQRRFYDYAKILQRSGTSQMTVRIVDQFEMINVHHQNTERQRSQLRTLRFSTEFNKERLT